MNQILYEDTGGRKPADLKNVIKFFGIALIAFGVILIIVGIIGIFNMIKNQAPETTNEPSIYVEKYDEKTIKISIVHDKVIEKVEYTWNNGEVETIPGINRKSIECLRDIPVGKNTLNITVTDSIGIIATYTGSYSNSNGQDIIEPTITLEEKVGKIHIIAQDETEISYITYRWNDGEETKVEASGEGSTIIELDVDVSKDLPIGENKFIVSAVDKNFNTGSETKIIKLLTKPKIQIPKQNADKLTITITDDIGIDYVEYKLNGKTYKWVSTSDDIVKWTYTATLDVGENDIVINVRNKEGIDADTFHGRCIYTQE